MTASPGRRAGKDGQAAKLSPRSQSVIRETKRLARLGHDLRGPAAAIVLLSEFLEEEVGDELNPANRELLSSIRLAAEVMLKRIDDLTTLATEAVSARRSPTFIGSDSDVLRRQDSDYLCNDAFGPYASFRRSLFALNRGRSSKI